MYNRYIRNDRGEYGGSVPREPPTSPPQDHIFSKSAGTSEPAGKKGLLSSLLGRFRLEDIDTGDLLLIAVIILLFRESDDDELLIALVLLLIL